VDVLIQRQTKEKQNIYHLSVPGDDDVFLFSGFFVWTNIIQQCIVDGLDQ